MNIKNKTGRTDHLMQLSLDQASVVVMLQKSYATEG